MGKKSAPAAPPPDPQIGQAALKEAETGEAWLQFSKDAFKVSQERQAEIDVLTKQIAATQIEAGDAQFDWAKQDRERYEKTFRPVEDQFIKEASEYGSQEKQTAAAAEARSDVLTAAAQERETAQRQAEAMGINPNSGRFAGINRAGELGTAVAAAGAENNARVATRDKGLALKADVANMGRGLPAQSAQATALGLNAGGSAAGLYGAANQQYIASTGIMGQGYRGAMAGYAGQADALNKQYATQVDAWKAEVASTDRQNAGIASGIGSIAGIGLGLFKSDENVKTDKVPIEEGRALAAINSMPVEEWTYKPGVEDEGRHIGTYAQDFQRATGKGDGKSILPQDAIGLTMKAVQDLDSKIRGLAVKIDRIAAHEDAEGGEDGPEEGEGHEAAEGPAHEQTEGMAQERVEQRGLGLPVQKDMKRAPGLVIAIAPQQRAMKRSPTRAAA